MIVVQTNTGQVVEVMLDKLNSLADTDKLLRTCATTVLSLMKTRIHEKGLDADNKPIGTYSKAYMVIRTGAFKNAKVFSKGKNAGKNKDAGTFTDRTIRLDRNTGVFSGEEKVGKARPKYNRTNDTKVILSLTRQMENDIKVIALTNGYGIGFTNLFNFQKSQWAEARYKKKIYALAPDEQQAVIDITEKHTKDAIS